MGDQGVRDRHERGRCRHQQSVGAVLEADRRSIDRDSGSDGVAQRGRPATAIGKKSLQRGCDRSAIGVRHFNDLEIHRRHRGACIELGEELRDLRDVVLRTEDQDGPCFRNGDEFEFRPTDADSSSRRHPFDHGNETSRISVFRGEGDLDTPGGIFGTVELLDQGPGEHDHLLGSADHEAVGSRITVDLDSRHAGDLTTTSSDSFDQNPWVVVDLVDEHSFDDGCDLTRFRMLQFEGLGIDRVGRRGRIERFDHGIDQIEILGQSHHDQGIRSSSGDESHLDRGSRDRTGDRGQGLPQGFGDDRWIREIQSPDSNDRIGEDTLAGIELFDHFGGDRHHRFGRLDDEHVGLAIGADFKQTVDLSITTWDLLAKTCGKNLADERFQFHGTSGLKSEESQAGARSGVIRLERGDDLIDLGEDLGGT